MMAINSQPNGGVSGNQLNYQIAPAPYQSVNGGLIGSSSLTMPGSGNNSSLQSMCCLVDNGAKCTRPSGNASYSKRIEKLVAQRKLRLSLDSRSSHSYICEHHKHAIQSLRTKRKSRSKDDDGDDEFPSDYNGMFDSSSEMAPHPPSLGSTGKPYGQTMEASLQPLGINTLRRYKRFFSVPLRPGINKSQMTEELNKHFRTLPVNEKEIINQFMYTLKNHANKLDFPPNPKHNNND